VNDVELLALHRELVATRSVSGEEAAIAGLVHDRLAAAGATVERIGDCVIATAGRGPVFCLNSHLDTVPPGAGWTRDPWVPVAEDGMVFGLGSNDAKASVAAMMAAFLRLAARPEELGVTVLLMLVSGEELNGAGTSSTLAELAARGVRPAAVLVGEPTGLDLAVAQKGLLILELAEKGQACHAAHARALGATNALRVLARDLVALDAIDLGDAHPELGPVTLEPTVVKGGVARNAVPGEASCILDVRTNPGAHGGELVRRLGAAIEGELRVISERLRPCAIPPDHPFVRAVHSVRPEARLFGSRGVSDLVFFADVPGIKVGPGRTERSHTADEFVLEAELLDGASFYELAVRACGSGLAGGGWS
jgi:acetylornithine deacetylase